MNVGFVQCQDTFDLVKLRNVAIKPEVHIFQCERSCIVHQIKIIHLHTQLRMDVIILERAIQVQVEAFGLYC